MGVPRRVFNGYFTPVLLQFWPPNAAKALEKRCLWGRGWVKNRSKRFLKKNYPKPLAGAASSSEAAEAGHEGQAQLLHDHLPVGRRRPACATVGRSVISCRHHRLPLRSPGLVALGSSRLHGSRRRSAPCGCAVAFLLAAVSGTHFSSSSGIAHESAGGRLRIYKTPHT